MVFEDFYWKFVNLVLHDGCVVPQLSAVILIVAGSYCDLQFKQLLKKLNKFILTAKLIFERSFEKCLQIFKLENNHLLSVELQFINIVY